MALQPYTEVDRAVSTVVPAQELSEEEYQKRVKDAEELQAKLTYITEKVPTRIMNTAGSNAGAGSGEFHMYRMARRREMLRLARIDEQAKEADEAAAFQKRRLEQLEGDLARTARRREKRQKKKKRPSGDKGPVTQSYAALPRAQSSDSDSDSPDQPALD